MTKLTPAMRQYLDIKEENKDAILFFRMGDFYEMFFEDARLASRVLGLTLTSRDKNREIPMCGIPHHASRTYISRLIKEGYKVAVCEQVEDPASAKGVVTRAVERVVTPGLALEDEYLDGSDNNFIAAALIGKKGSGLAYMDVLTGEFRVSEFSDPALISDEIGRISVSELLLVDGDNASGVIDRSYLKNVSTLSAYDFSHDTAVKRLNEHFGTVTLDGFGCAGFNLSVRAAGALLHYVSTTQKAELRHIKRLTPHFPSEHLILDDTTRRNLEITANSRTGDKAGTLLSLLDVTKTAMGSRLLKDRLLNPLMDIEEILARLDAVEEFLECRRERSLLVEELDRVYDLERLNGRVSMRVAAPRDLIALKDSLLSIPSIKNVASSLKAERITSITASLDPVKEASSLIERAINDEPPANLKDGGVIREGYSRELDELREIGDGGKDWVARLEKTEKEKTGIQSLKVGYNKVFGYYLTVPKAKVEQVPVDYIRKQTLVNAERYITPELKDWEAKILGAEERAREIESAIFTDVREEVASMSERIRKTAGAVAELDVLIALSTVAGKKNYVKPSLNSGSAINIIEGRHPVIEASSVEPFVPNDLRLDSGDEQIHILTGPNMAGKSTYMRQNALLVLMAQSGSFVPAASADIGVVDRIFTRVGASDDISRGQSTFMVEMNETANIVNNATERSFVILDEIGRGTSTFDGLSIAWAVTEFLHDHKGSGCGPKTLFATHYHELTELSLTKERVKNYNMAVKEWNEDIIFLKKVVAGGASRSYGIQVARLAGLPPDVIKRAGEILKNLEVDELDGEGSPRIAHTGKGDDLPLKDGQLALIAAPRGNDKLTQFLDGIELEKTTPFEALTALYRLKELSEK